MKWTKFIISLAIPLAAGAIAGTVTANNVNTWYPQLNKPSFNPPNWLFGPVWTILYIMMGIALYLVWTKPASHIKSRAMALFFVQLALNFIWSFLFFQWHLIGMALVDISILWIAIISCLLVFSRISKPAAWLFVPYLLWVSFAASLNAAIYMLN
ncbi:TspO/MBR family protein [Filimonas effusa]|uniref:Tryptophan-rich sensory protein n=1 Tax=Filimonas effusa TaxID=2508721 RepID=A0A4Q1D5K0_9BACT|nr:TspO/MBR family protein [Filimonas effusa]RXK83668.1 tryptophan-rich sensory protein [Filimonas effusa]